jgi:hypothetical protein
MLLKTNDSVAKPLQARGWLPSCCRGICGLVGVPGSDAWNLASLLPLGEAAASLSAPSEICEHYLPANFSAVELQALLRLANQLPAQRNRTLLKLFRRADLAQRENNCPKSKS